MKHDSFERFRSIENVLNKLLFNFQMEIVVPPCGNSPALFINFIMKFILKRFISNVLSLISAIFLISVLMFVSIFWVFKEKPIESLTAIGAVFITYFQVSSLVFINYLVLTVLLIFLGILNSRILRKVLFYYLDFLDMFEFKKFIGYNRCNPFKNKITWTDNYFTSDVLCLNEKVVSVTKLGDFYDGDIILPFGEMGKIMIHDVSNLNDRSLISVKNGGVELIRFYSDKINLKKLCYFILEANNSDFEKLICKNSKGNYSQLHALKIVELIEICHRDNDLNDIYEIFCCEKLSIGDDIITDYEIRDVEVPIFNQVLSIPEIGEKLLSHNVLFWGKSKFDLLYYVLNEKRKFSSPFKSISNCRYRKYRSDINLMFLNSGHKYLSQVEKMNPSNFLTKVMSDQIKINFKMPEKIEEAEIIFTKPVLNGCKEMISINNLEHLNNYFLRLDDRLSLIFGKEKTIDVVRDDIKVSAEKMCEANIPVLEDEKLKVASGTLNLVKSIEVLRELAEKRKKAMDGVKNASKLNKKRIFSSITSLKEEFSKELIGGKNKLSELSLENREINEFDKSDNRWDVIEGVKNLSEFVKKDPRNLESLKKSVSEDLFYLKNCVDENFTIVKEKSVIKYVKPKDIFMKNYYDILMKEKDSDKTKAVEVIKLKVKMPKPILNGPSKVKKGKGNGNISLGNFLNAAKAEARRNSKKPKEKRIRAGLFKNLGRSDFYKTYKVIADKHKNLQSKQKEIQNLGLKEPSPSPTDKLFPETFSLWLLRVPKNKKYTKETSLEITRVNRCGEIRNESKKVIDYIQMRDFISKEDKKVDNFLKKAKEIYKFMKSENGEFEKLDLILDSLLEFDEKLSLSQLKTDPRIF